MKINELALPGSLERDLDARRWPPDDRAMAALTALLKRLESPLPSLYEREGIQTENRAWISSDEDFYLGALSHRHSPGTVDRNRTVIIGQAEPDSPIALDYRVNPPRVVYLGDADGQTYWFELAPSYDALVVMLGITPALH